MSWIIEGIVVNIIWEIINILFQCLAIKNKKNSNYKQLRIIFVMQYISTIIFSQTIIPGLFFLEKNIINIFLLIFPTVFGFLNSLSIFNYFFNNTIKNKTSKRSSNRSNNKSQMIQK